mmetsp:Transcript_7543/g.17094  ORF Transcript_7543/g.17094 Transcript_7543/m.17094 type:complete len:399 (-) Transcript_7543:67-1263(-)|eukprot:CAMPEP_0172320384 /NCGR_PEP_ID=MMETSP1058-20130122/40450_1 /TAXON_ID=83371 /ORGANISM="Detonula confervacea, Strain CCMP 353" /LENGTH=398 /DNA_ID=CAMNT_0013035645 /DNA_START=256 /DNA_END=1452 /DNA_ORIENTATION=+
MSQKIHCGPPRSGQQDQEWETVEVHVNSNLNEVQIISPEFTCFGHTWRLQIRPATWSDPLSPTLPFALTLCNRSNKSIKVMIAVSIRKFSGQQLAHYKAGESSNFGPYDDYNGEDDDFYCDGGEFQGPSIGIPDFNLSRSTLLYALEEGPLIIEIRMKPIDPASVSIPFVPQNPLGKAMLNLFMNEESADVVFETPTQNFHAHRFILKQCAPMLDEMCVGAEGGLLSVPIPDVQADIFGHILYYVYGGKVGEQEFKMFNAKEILDAADKYGVPNLKLEAEAFLVNSITLDVDNMMEHLLYADSKNCALLKESVMDFIANNEVEVLENVSLKDLPGGMFADLLTAVARGKKKDAANMDGSSDEQYSTMRISDLRRKLDEEGLDIDGSRETLIGALEENS